MACVVALENDRLEPALALSLGQSGIIRRCSCAPPSLYRVGRCGGALPGVGLGVRRGCFSPKLAVVAVCFLYGLWVMEITSKPFNFRETLPGGANHSFL